jgi:hypothetical protein
MQSQVPGPVSLIMFLVPDVPHASPSDDAERNERRHSFYGLV